MSQIALPLDWQGQGETIVTSPALAPLIAALGASATWPYRTAVLTGPPRSGKSLFARWFAASGAGQALDQADRLDETHVFHRWNRAQAEGHALLLVGAPGWRVTLPDLASRLGAALALAMPAPDDDLLRALIAEHARRRALPLADTVLDWLVPRIERSHAACEAIVATLDQRSLERKAPVTLALAREVLAGGNSGLGQWQPRLL